MDSRLTPLQRDVLDSFFRREDRFLLTGDAALAGFHLGHRTTHGYLVRDRAPQIHAQKVLSGAIRVDPADEILANKLCALLSRTENRDLVDVMALERSGLDLEAAIRTAARKDAGFSPGQLCYILSQMTIGEDARIPGSTPSELRSFISAFIARLARLAFP